MYEDSSPIIIFILLAIALVILPLILQSLMSPKDNKGGDKLLSYECGELPEGSAWVKFNIRFYIIALIFIIFDVEVIFMFPWAAVFQEFVSRGYGLLAFVEMMLFLVILLVGFAYVWVKSDLDWVKMKLKYAYGRYGHLKKNEESV